MSDQTTEPRPSPDAGATTFDCGGLRFEATFRAPQGATLRVSADINGQPTELVRFDDFVDGPHYHLPGAGPALPFDRDEKGEPLAWIVAELRDDLGSLLTTAGYAGIMPDLDGAAITANAERIRQAMEDVVPDGYARVPGVGLQRTAAGGTS
jgi:hypothetical protein